MYQGSLPYFTKGPLAHFYGGEQISKKLTDEAPGLEMFVLLSISIVFQSAMFLYVKCKTYKHQNITDYVQSLRGTIVKNVLNLYGVILIIVFNIIGVIFLISHHIRISENKTEVLQEKQDKEKENIISTGTILFASVMFLAVIWPYRSHALR